MMRFQKSFWLVMLLVLALTFALAGCGGSSKDDDDPSGPPAGDTDTTDNSPLVEGSLIGNGNFSDTDISKWDLKSNDGSVTGATVQRSLIANLNCLEFFATTTGTIDWHTQLQYATKLSLSGNYKLSLKFWADKAGKTAKVLLQNSGYACPIAQDIVTQTTPQIIEKTTDWSITAGDSSWQVMVNVGGADNNGVHYYLTDISLIPQ